MKKIFLLSIIAILIIVIIIFFTGTSQKESIYSEISNANFCNVDSDCVTVNFGCPFGCGSYVNKDSDIDGIKELIRKHNKVPCEYSCMTPPEPKCVNGRCTLPDCDTEIHEEISDFRECKCPKGTDIISVPDYEKNVVMYKCESTICEKGKPYETAWQFEDGSWWDECICPEGAVKSDKFIMSGLYFFRCD